MNKSIRDIYADYRYESLETEMVLKELSLEDEAGVEVAKMMVARLERLEALIDLYAYLLACQQGGGSRR